MFAHDFQNEVFRCDITHFIGGFYADDNDTFKIRLHDINDFAAGNMLSHDHAEQWSSHGVFSVCFCQMYTGVSGIGRNNDFFCTHTGDADSHTDLISYRLMDFIDTPSQKGCFQFGYDGRCCNAVQCHRGHLLVFYGYILKLNFTIERKLLHLFCFLYRKRRKIKIRLEIVYTIYDFCCYYKWVRV